MSHNGNVYSFFYDETEHSRKINERTINADNYFDDFTTVIVGWKEGSNQSITRRYIEFEKKYHDMIPKGELKSTIIKNRDFRYGFASCSKKTTEMISDFLDIFEKDVLVYISTTSKIEYIISQIFCNYKSCRFTDENLYFDAPCMRYSIVKALITYQPQSVIDAMYNYPQNLKNKLIEFLSGIIEINKTNLSLKENENEAYQQIVAELQDFESIQDERWDYRPPFRGFLEYLESRGISSYSLTIDKEGDVNTESKTKKAAENVGVANIDEADSKECVGIRMADMFAGIISKFFKALSVATHPQLHNNIPTKTLLCDEWFELKKGQMELYVKLNRIFTQQGQGNKMIHTGIYSDDIISFLCLCSFFNDYSKSFEMQKNGKEQLGECYNKCVCTSLIKYYDSMHLRTRISLM